MENESIAIWNCITVEVGHKKQELLLITCYMVPLLFFAIMGGIFTSIMPESKDTLVPAMTVMGASMGCINWFTAVFGRNIWQWYEKSL